jgi:SARP family transcriptional regulator, regulator of embCAB operon
LLGGFGLSDGRVDIAIAEGPQRLLAFLALRKRPVRRTLAAGALWPDVSQEHAGSSLRSTLARLDEGARSALAVTASQLAIADRSRWTCGSPKRSHVVWPVRTSR